MLIQDILRASLSQWTFECRVCGETKTKSGPNQKFCAGCRSEARRQYIRKIQPTRPKRGVRAIGDEARCITCDATFIIAHSQQKFCSGCAKPKPLHQERIGDTFACANCSAIVVKTAQRQCYCTACRDLYKRHQLPIYKQRKSEAHSLKYRSDPAYRSRQNARALKDQNARYANNPAFALNVRMRTAIGASLSGQKKGRRWERLVGYTMVDLMSHIKRQFLPGMSWENRSEWHLDHIRPLSMFKFTAAEDHGFKDAWALTNLRPLWGPDNLRKWAKRTHLI